MAEKHERVELEKSLNPANIWAVALGSIIGWGAFIQSPNWMVKAGGPLPLVLGFLLGGALMLIVGFSYAYMIAKFPVAGGEFAYAYVGFGPIASYVCGWMLSVGYFGIVALNATAVPVLFSILTPGLLQKGLLWTIAGWPVYKSAFRQSAAAGWAEAFRKRQEGSLSGYRCEYRGYHSGGNRAGKGKSRNRCHKCTELRLHRQYPDLLL